MAQRSFELQEAVERRRRQKKWTPDGAAILNRFKRAFSNHCKPMFLFFFEAEKDATMTAYVFKAEKNRFKRNAIEENAELTRCVKSFQQHSFRLPIILSSALLSTPLLFVFIIIADLVRPNLHHIFYILAGYPPHIQTECFLLMKLLCFYFAKIPHFKNER